MPSRAQIHATLTTLPTGPPLVIAIIGGTSGIGSYTAKAFASVYRNAGSKLRVYLVGRDASRAEALLTDVRSTSPGSEWRFLKANDLAMMSDVDTVCAQIKRYEEEEPLKGGGPRIDMLYMSQAFSPLAPSGRTMEDRIDAKNLPIGPPPPKKYGVTSVRTHVSFMKTYLFEALAEKHAGKISFIHIYPGLVDGPTFLSPVNPLWFRILWRVAKVLMAWYMTSPESDKEGNDVAFSSMGERGGGAYAVGQRGDEKKEVSYAKLRQSDTRDRVWKHTMGVLEGVQGLAR
ncbi:hypothetical protein CC77DRAFT_1032508 [Alternaria alternata]|uniref:NAD(P)-binding protein n=1 Tax=Alternaria alternata TaxID=5599 RepID=A0A177DGW5_ALTAL|nr:hypothetical protein CC77DRAFT_1032508 [Alternaria alternata]OAG19124.1 hypothetical protein CC77DRAFT_1032508 [Alternaria alternata]